MPHGDKILNMKKTHLGSRRYFLSDFFGKALALTIPTVLIKACRPAKNTRNPGQATASDGLCEQLDGVEKVELDKRKALGYVSQSPIQDKQCDNCKLYVPPKPGNDCGGCLLFAGPVAAQAHCTYWAPQI